MSLSSSPLLVTNTHTKRERETMASDMESKVQCNRIVVYEEAHRVNWGVQSQVDWWREEEERLKHVH